MSFSSMKKFLTGLCAASLLLVASGAHAVPILLQDNNVGVGILNLEVGGTLYNVNFEFDEWPDIYGNPPVFTFDAALAQEANEKVNAVLNGANTDNEKVKQVGPPQEEQANEGFPLYAIGVSYDDPYVNWIGATFVDNLDLWIDDFLTIPVAGSQNAEQAWMWAQFTVVPVPAAVWLFGSALGLLGWIRKRTTA